MSRLLVVDDDPAILGSLAMLLSDRYDVVVARNGEEAVERLAEMPVDLVVLDMLMPLLDGEGVLRDIRRRGLRVPVIIASARGDRLANYKALGANDFIQKPFGIDVLEKKIARLLRFQSRGGGTSYPGASGADSGGGRGIGGGSKLLVRP